MDDTTIIGRADGPTQIVVYGSISPVYIITALIVVAVAVLALILLLKRRKK